MRERGREHKRGGGTEEEGEEQTPHWVRGSTKGLHLGAGGGG